MASIGKFKIKVIYTWGENSIHVYDHGFRKERIWDIDLLSGYDYIFTKNISKEPGSHHYKGIINPDLISQVETYNPDTVLIYGWKFDSHLRVMRHFKGKIPIIFRGDSTLLDESNRFSLKKWGRQQLLKWVYEHIDHALSPGTASDEYFRWVRLKFNQIHRVVHAVENERFMGEIGNGKWQMEQKALTWRRELGITDEKKVFLFAGKFEPKKDPLLLIQAFKQLLQIRSDIHLIMVGNGILEKEIERELNDINKTHGSSQPLSTSLNFSQHSSTPSTFPITLLPFQNQSFMPIVYRLGDVFVLPSKGPGETWGLAINEAMASGRPVIASNKCGGAIDLVINEHNGLVFTAGDQKDLLSKIEFMVNANTREMGENAQKHIVKFNYQKFALSLGEILN